MGEPATDQDLRELEEAVGAPLPPSFRRLLARFGGGLFYQGNEIFGPHRVMIHDIEMVPSLAAMLARLRAQSLPAGLVPFHRLDALIHLLDTRDPVHPDRVVSLPAGSAYPDLVTFLGAVVVPKTAS